MSGLYASRRLSSEGLRAPTGTVTFLFNDIEGSTRLRLPRRRSGSSEMTDGTVRQRRTRLEISRSVDGSDTPDRRIPSTVPAALMGNESSTITERRYIHLFDRQRTDDAVRAAMAL